MPRAISPRLLRLLIALSFAYAVIRVTACVVHFLSGQAHFQNDIGVQYHDWLAFIDPAQSHRVLETLYYLPHTWILLTPLFALGWPVTMVCWFAIQFLLHGYICWRICRLVGLEGQAQWLVVGYYWCVLGVGLTIALGNLGVVAFAALLAAYPFSAGGKTTTWLTISAIKHTTVYPVFLWLLGKRWKSVVPALLAVAAVLVAAHVWAGVDLRSLPDGIRRGRELSEAWMRRSEPVAYVPLLEALLGRGWPTAVVGWSIWLSLFAAACCLIKDELILLAALVLLGLLPMYHRGYDLFMAGLAIGLFVKHGHLVTASLITLALAGLYDFALKREPGGWGVLHRTELYYYPLLILGIIAALVILDRAVRLAGPRPIAPPASP